MKLRKAKPDYESERELHRIFKMMMERFDNDPEADLSPKIDYADQFLNLYRLQGSPPWLRFYELDPCQLTRFMLQGMEEAIGLEPLSEEVTPAELTGIIDKLLLALKGESEVDPDLISDNVRLLAIPLMLVSRCLQVIHVCQLQYKQPIQILIVEAAACDVDAFLDLVKLDSSFLYTPYGRRMVLEAELKNDLQFKMNLTDVLEPDPKFWSWKGKRKQYAMLMLFALGDFAYRTNSEWADFLSQHGFSDWADSENVRKARDRYGLSRLKK